jgi:nicotinate-nucleotide adenylyltransferase
VTRSLRGATGVFGGTFDPIHYAHLAVAEAAREAFDLRRVLFIPAAQPPHKPDRSIAAAEHRFGMVQIAIADNPGFEVSRIEVDRDGPSYTVDTLAALRAVAPDDRLALILSEESFSQLGTWHQPEHIVQLADVVIVAPREGYLSADAMFVLPDHGQPPPADVVFLDGPRIRLSASEIRERARTGRSLRYLVPDAVAAYIGDHGLYQDQRRTDRS